MAAISAAIILGAAAIGSSIAQGRRQEKAQKKAMQMQEQEQNRALQRQLLEQRRAEQQEAKVSAKQPDISSLMSVEQQRSLSGPTATMLTGTGAGADNAKIKTTTLLGE